jgi:hypothetical protein
MTCRRAFTAGAGFAVSARLQVMASRPLPQRGEKECGAGRARQTILSAILIFLFGLAVRNLLRLK